MDISRTIISTIYCVSGVLLVLFFVVTGIKDFRCMKAIPNDARYIVQYSEKTPRTKLSKKDWIVTDDSIYILLEENSQVNVYDLMGAFRYSIQMEHIRNGKSRIAYVYGKLFVKTRANSILEFDEAKLINCLPASNDEEGATSELYRGYQQIIFDFDPSEYNKKSGVVQIGNSLCKQDGSSSMVKLIEIPRSYKREFFIIAIILGIVAFFLTIILERLKIKREL